jgi:hypothetical protein
MYFFIPDNKRPILATDLILKNAFPRLLVSKNISTNYFFSRARNKKENHRNFKYLKCLIYVLYLLLPVSTMYNVPQPSLSSAGGKTLKFTNLFKKSTEQKGSNFALLFR